MYKKNATLNLILFFIGIIVAGQTTLYAGEIPGAVKFKTSDPRSYSAQGRMAITKERRERQMKLKRDIAQAEQEEKQIKRNIAKAEQENMRAEQEIKVEQVHVQELEEKLASEPAGSEQTSFLKDQWEKAKQNISALKQTIIDNKGKIAIAAAILGTAFLVYKNRQGSKTEESPVELPATNPFSSTRIPTPQETFEELHPESQRYIESLPKNEQEKALKLVADIPTNRSYIFLQHLLRDIAKGTATPERLEKWNRLINKGN